LGEIDSECQDSEAWCSVLQGTEALVLGSPLWLTHGHMVVLTVCCRCIWGSPDHQSGGRTTCMAQWNPSERLRVPERTRDSLHGDKAEQVRQIKRTPRSKELSRKEVPMLTQEARCSDPQGAPKENCFLSFYPAHTGTSAGVTFITTKPHNDLNVHLIGTS
jgi:hypothetical protein